MHTEPSMVISMRLPAGSGKRLKRMASRHGWTPSDASRAMSRMHEADAAMKGMSRMPPSLGLERALAESL